VNEPVSFAAAFSPEWSTGGDGSWGKPGGSVCCREALGGRKGGRRGGYLGGTLGTGKSSIYRGWMFLDALVARSGPVGGAGVGCYGSGTSAAKYSPGVLSGSTIVVTRWRSGFFEGSDVERCVCVYVAHYS
jgi:hypothetical protein